MISYFLPSGCLGTTICLGFLSLFFKICCSWKSCKKHLLLLVVLDIQVCLIFVMCITLLCPRVADRGCICLMCMCKSEPKHVVSEPGMKPKHTYMDICIRQWWQAYTGFVLVQVFEKEWDFSAPCRCLWRLDSSHNLVSFCLIQTHKHCLYFLISNTARQTYTGTCLRINWTSWNFQVSSHLQASRHCESSIYYAIGLIFM